MLLNKLFSINFFLVDKKVSLNFKDKLFFFLTFIIPSHLFGFIPLDFNIAGIIDLRIIQLLLGMWFIFISIDEIGKFSKSWFGFFLLILVGYIVLVFGNSLFSEIPIDEIIKSFRIEFYTPISVLGLLLYAQKLSLPKFLYIFNIYLKFFTIQLLLYILQAITGLQIFPPIKEEMIESIGKIEITRNLSGFPNIFPWFTILFALLLMDRNKTYLYTVLLILAAIFFSATRSFIVVSIIIMITTIFLSWYAYSYVKFKKNIKSFLVILTGLILLISLSSDYYNFIIQKFDVTLNQEVKENAGTYAFRQKINNSAIEELQQKNSLLMGNGYQRAANIGEYDFVFGGDTNIAPVIYTEGVMGLILRIMPILSLLLFYMRNLKRQSFKYQYICIGYISYFMASIPNYVQTDIFRNYFTMILLFGLFQVFLVKFINQENKKITYAS